MRFANHRGRLTLVRPDGQGVDLHEATGGQVSADPAHALERWDDVLQLAGNLNGAAAVDLDSASLASPSPAPRQIFGVGLNYADHAAEANLEPPDVPLIFTKLGTAVTGPFGSIAVTTETVDWEVETVVVIGRRASNVSAADAWDHVAGITAGQDLSDRDIQWRPKGNPQFGLGKSLPGFAPMGPFLVTPDEFGDRDDIELSCTLNGDEVQRSSTAQLIFPVDELIAYLSAITPLLPGDAIFTGTPPGVGMARTPARYLAPGDVLESFVAGVGTMSHTFTGGGEG